MMNKILLFGAFDVLHKGHIEMLKQAKELGDFLCVVVAADDTIESAKGHKPRQSSSRRIQALKDLHLIDKVTLGDSDPDTWDIIKKEKPDIIALGYDQDELKMALESFLNDSYPDIEDEQKNWQNNPKRPKIVTLDPYHPEKYKSSLIQ